MMIQNAKSTSALLSLVIKHGRYIVRFPLRSPATSLGVSTSTTLRCLSQLGRRFKDNAAYLKLYTDFLQEYQFLGHMTPVPESDIEQFPVFYLPHHGVLREQSLSTKLRVVFNGSSRSDNGVSLNDILYSGAKLQNGMCYLVSDCINTCSPQT